MYTGGLIVTRKQAVELRDGDRVTAVVEDPYGGESRWSGADHRWIYEPVWAGQVVVFQRLIPKVSIVRNGPCYAEHGITRLMPSRRLCRVRRTDCMKCLVFAPFCPP